MTITRPATRTRNLVQLAARVIAVMFAFAITIGTIELLARVGFIPTLLVAGVLIAIALAPWSTRTDR